MLFPGHKDFIQKIRAQKETEVNQEITKRLSATGAEAYIPYAEKAQAFRENASMAQTQLMKSASQASPVVEEEKKESVSKSVSVEQITSQFESLSVDTLINVARE